MRRTDRVWTILTLISLLAGTGVRLYAAWTVRHLPWRDASIPMLMSRHFARGEPLSTFYYGQAYMGSLEAWVSSLVMRILGPTPFAACLGTVLLSVVSLILLVGMARKVAGARAGCLASLFLIATSDASLYLSVHPRGGYMVMQVCGLGVVLLMSRFLRNLDEDSLPVVSWELPLAGLLAGIGWWNLQLVVVYLIAAVIVGLPRLGRLIRRPDLYLAVGTFVVGASPWLLWNIRQAGASVSMGGTIGAVGLETGMARFAKQALDMMGWNVPVGWMAFRLAAGTFLLIGALVMLFRQWLRAPVPAHRDFRGLGIHLWVLGVTAGIYSLSHFSSFNTPRYLLPLYPSFALIAGVVLDGLCKIRKGVILVVPLLALTLAQNNFKLHKWTKDIARNDAAWELAGRLSEVLNTVADGVALGGPMQHWLNVASEEQAMIVEAPVDIYAPYNREWALVKKQAVLDHDRRFAGFLKESGGHAQLKRMSGLHLYHTLQAPGLNVKPLSVALQEDISCATGPGEVLIDGDAGTWVEPDQEGTVDVTWSFPQSVDVAGVVFPCLTQVHQGLVRVWGEQASGKWRLLKETGPGTPYFWSGQRLVHMGMGYHRQIRWPSVSVVGLRVECLDLDQPLREVMLLVPDPDANEDQEVDLQAFTERVSDVVATRSVIDRMPSGDGPKRSLRSSFWERGLDEIATRDPDSFFYLPAWPSVDVQVRPAFAENSRHALNRAGLSWEETMLEGAVLFHIGPLDPGQYPGAMLPIAFTEMGLFFDSDFRLDRWNRAVELLQEAENMASAEARQRWITEASRLCPESVTVYQKALTHGSKVKEGLAGVEPQHPLNARFQNGLILRGLDATVSGSEWTLTWFWQIPAGVDLRERSLFVHIVQDGKIRFQDDHNPGHEVELEHARAQPLDRVVAVKRVVTIPEGISGEMEIHTGWIDPATGKRLRIQSGERVEKGKLRIRGEWGFGTD